MNAKPGKSVLSRLLQGAALGVAVWHGGAAAAVETRSVAGFDEVLFAVAGELQIEQGDREGLTLDAEPKVLRMITTEQHDKRLYIGLARGRVETQQPIIIKLKVRSLREFESRTAGTIKVGPLVGETLVLSLAGGGSIRVARLSAQSLEVRIAGAGDVSVDAGQVSTQRITIGGVGGYVAPALASQRAEVGIDGSGKVQLAASGTLSVRIGGIGHVRYRGEPQITRTIHGIGTIEKD